MSEVKALKKLPIDWESLLWCAGRSEAYSHPDLFDTQTGEVVCLHQDVVRCVERGDRERLSQMPAWQQEQIPMAEQYVSDQSGRFLWIPTPDRGERYEAMLDFACLPELGGPGDQLLEALDGRGAFGRFKQVLGQNRRAQRGWNHYEQDWEREWISDWLRHHGIDPEPAERPRGSQPK